MAKKTAKKAVKKTAKKDYDKDGKVESPSDEYKGARGKAIQKAKFTKHKGKGKKLMEAAEVAKFIAAISSENYAQANKYLKGIIEDKLQARISASLNEPLF